MSLCRPDLTQVIGAVRSSLGPGSVMDAATGLIESSQAAKALQLLEAQPQMRKNPGLLALAGVAAWRSDNDRKALEYRVPKQTTAEVLG